MSTLQIATPRVFLPLLQPARYKGAHGGRGSGKSHFFAELLVETCLIKTTRAVCLREIQKSIKQSVKLLIEDKIKHLGVSAQFEVLESEIRVIAGPGKGGLIIFQGMQNHTADSIKSLEGFDIAWLAEAQAFSQRSLDLLRPTIRKEGSEIWADWNPETPDVPIDQLLRGPKKVDGIVVEANWRDNPFLPEVLRIEMEQDKARDPDKYLNIWEGKYRQALEGAVYANELRKAIEENRITHVPVDDTSPVIAIFDLGRADMTSIWFVQLIGFEFRIVDFYQNSGFALNHYLTELQNRKYRYGHIILPHDADHELLASERTIAEQVRTAFPNADVEVLERTSVESGIEAARAVFSRCWFDQTRCEEGLKALRSYRYDVDEDGSRSARPLHDWASHAADAFRYMAVCVTGPKKPSQALKYKRTGIV